MLLSQGMIAALPGIHSVDNTAEWCLVRAPGAVETAEDQSRGSAYSNTTYWARSSTGSAAADAAAAPGGAVIQQLVLLQGSPAEFLGKKDKVPDEELPLPASCCKHGLAIVRETWRAIIVGLASIEPGVRGGAKMAARGAAVRTCSFAAKYLRAFPRRGWFRRFSIVPAGRTLQGAGAK